MATCCQPSKKSRPTGVTRCQPWDLSWVETRTCWTPIIEYTTIGLWVSQDMKPPKSILRKSTDMPKPIHRAKFTKAGAFHTEIRDQDPSLGMICPGEPHQRSKIWGSVSRGDRIARARCSRSSVEAGQKCFFLWKEHERTTFFSPSENRCLLAFKSWTWEREFVVDSGASMHMISKKDLSDVEMDTLTKSCSLTIVINANGEVQTHEEATVYVKELDLFLSMKSPRKWLTEKLHLDNARKLRGILFTDPEDEEFKETIKNAVKKLETPIAPVLLCKILKKNCWSGASNKIETRLACILEEASESARLRMGE